MKESQHAGEHNQTSIVEKSQNGVLNIEEFLNWLYEVEREFDCMVVKEHHRVKLVMMRFKGCAVASWDKTVAN